MPQDRSGFKSTPQFGGGRVTSFRGRPLRRPLSFIITGVDFSQSKKRAADQIISPQRARLIGAPMTMPLKIRTLPTKTSNQS
jgi:hypothetical protein